MERRDKRVQSLHEGIQMTFDEKIEEIYSDFDWRTKDRLKEIIFSYPEEYRTLLGLRASFVKWTLIREKKLDRHYQQEDHCGVCVTTEEPCDVFCPLHEACKKRRRNSIKANLRAIYEAYMKEHNKWKKQ